MADPIFNVPTGTDWLVFGGASVIAAILPRIMNRERYYDDVKRHPLMRQSNSKWLKRVPFSLIWTFLYFVWAVGFFGLYMISGLDYIVDSDLFAIFFCTVVGHVGYLIFSNKWVEVFVSTRKDGYTLNSKYSSFFLTFFLLAWEVVLLGLTSKLFVAQGESATNNFGYRAMTLGSIVILTAWQFAAFIFHSMALIKFNSKHNASSDSEPGYVLRAADYASIPETSGKDTGIVMSNLGASRASAFGTGMSKRK